MSRSVLAFGFGCAFFVLSAVFGVALPLALGLSHGQSSSKSPSLTNNEIRTFSELAWSIVGLTLLASGGSIVGALLALASGKRRVEAEDEMLPAITSRSHDGSANPLSGAQFGSAVAIIPVTRDIHRASPPLVPFDATIGKKDDTFVLMVTIHESEHQVLPVLRRGASYLQAAFRDAPPTEEDSPARREGRQGVFMLESRSIVAVIRHCSAEEVLRLAVALHSHLEARDPVSPPLPLAKGRKSVWFREMAPAEDRRYVALSLCGASASDTMCGAELHVFPTSLLTEARRLLSLARRDRCAIVVNDFVHRSVSCALDFKMAKVLTIGSEDGELAPTTVVLRAIERCGGRSQGDASWMSLCDILSSSGHDQPSDDDTASQSRPSTPRREGCAVFEAISSLDRGYFQEAVVPSPDAFARNWAALWDAAASGNLEQFREAAATLGSGWPNRSHVQRLLRELVKISDVLPQFEAVVETSSATSESPQRHLLPFACRPRFDSQFTTVSEVEIDPTVARQLQMTSRGQIFLPKGLIHTSPDSAGELSADSSGDDRVVEPFRLIDGKGDEWQVSQTILGAGRSGTVHLGLSAERGSICAVKAVPLARLRNVEGGQPTQTDLRAEVETLCRLRHANLLRLLGFASNAKTAFLIMEYVSGGSLDGLVESFGKLSLKTVKGYTRGMLQGLACLHRHGIIHRDLKPPNVLVTVNGECKISDFGSAVRVSGDSAQDPAPSWLRSQGGIVAGSPLFMAPEQARAEAVPSSDVWSLGLTVHYMLTGRLPYGQDVCCLPPAAFVYRLGSGGCVPYIDEQDLHSSAATFLRRCFVVDPLERATATELLEHSWLLDDPDSPTT